MFAAEHANDLSTGAKMEYNITVMSSPENEAVRATHKA